MCFFLSVAVPLFFGPRSIARLAASICIGIFCANSVLTPCEDRIKYCFAVAIAREVGVMICPTCGVYPARLSFFGGLIPTHFL